MRPFIDVLPVSQRKGGSGLQVDGVSLQKLLGFGYSPVYVTALSAVEARAKAYLNALHKNFSSGHVYYALKANFALPVLRTIRDAGCGADIVSIGEWRRALEAGFKPADICFAGVGKMPSEWKESIAGGLGTLNVEHLAELDDVLAHLESHNAPTQLAVRLNPCVESKTHPHLKTGALDSKFGILFEQLVEWVSSTEVRCKSRDAFLALTKPLSGIHVHVGSQLENPEILALVIKKTLSCAEFLVSKGINIRVLDLGGGLHVGFDGVPADNGDITRHIDFLGGALREHLSEYPALSKLWGARLERLDVSVEPGRSVVASSTVFLSKVLFEKTNSDTNRFCYVDGAMNDFPRPSIYGARHALALVDFAAGVQSQSYSYKVVGPVCESADVLAKDVELPKVTAGDTLCFFEAGAYCRSMASHYNLRALPAEIFVKGGQVVEVTAPKNLFGA